MKGIFESIKKRFSVNFLSTLESLRKGIATIESYWYLDSKFLLYRPTPRRSSWRHSMLLTSSLLFLLLLFYEQNVRFFSSRSRRILFVGTFFLLTVPFRWCHITIADVWFTVLDDSYAYVLFLICVASQHQYHAVLSFWQKRIQTRAATQKIELPEILVGKFSAEKKRIYMSDWYL